jgi:hypothetical protein
MLAQMELSLGTDKALDFLDDAETAAARLEATKVGA